MAVPITVRMISGRKRIRSVELTRLAAIVRLQYHGMALAISTRMGTLMRV
jgi:hypothetical protein